MTGGVRGEAFGRYRLDELLGTGGVGEVWRAWDSDLHRFVALKLLQPRFRTDPTSAARFHREAKLVARLRHPHIVRVHSFGTIEGRLYIDMELVEGRSLAAELADGGPLGPRRLARLVGGLADALDTAHALDRDPSQRLIHRDVKPANVLLEPRPQGREHAWLVDFGIARIVGPGPSVTSAGTVVGTPAYMAPELWDTPRRADHRVDVYALAVLVFESLTGRVPFEAEDLDSLVAAHLAAPVPRASEPCDRLPPALDDVLARGKAKDPGARQPTAGELAAQLRAALLTPDGPGAGPPRAPDRPSLRRSFLGSPRHFAGLAATSLLAPLFAMGVLRSAGALVLSAAVLYGLGVAVVAILKAPHA